HEPGPGIDRRGVEGESFLPKAVALGQERRDPQLALEPVGPPVVGATDRAFEAPVRGARVLADRGILQHQTRAAVPADLVVGPEPAVAGPHHQEALARHVDMEVVARGPRRLLPPAEEPLAVEYEFRLALEPRRRPVR